MNSSGRDFTTGDVAKMCRVSQQTIIRCFDNGSLKGWRVPGSKFRRIPAGNLRQFLMDNEIPTAGVMGQAGNLLLVSNDRLLIACLKKLPAKLCGMVVAESVYQAGQVLLDMRPASVIVDCQIGREGAESMLRACGNHLELSEISLIALATGENENEDEVIPGADITLSKSAVISLLSSLV